MVSKRKRILLLLLLLLGGPLSAQDRENDQSFSALYRGKVANNYAFKYNGTYCWDERGLQEGSVMYNGKLYEGVFLQVDAYADELNVQPGKNTGLVVPYGEQVAWFKKGATWFVNLRYLGWTDAPQGFYEVVRDGERPLLRNVKKRLLTAGGNHNGDEIGYVDPEYDGSISTYFRQQETFYVIEQGLVRKISRRAYRRELRKEAGAPLLAALETPWHSTEERVSAGTVAQADLPGTGNGLPTGYFESVKQDTITVQYVDTPQMATYRNKVYTVGDRSQDKGGARKTVSGVITEAETGEPMYGVVVFDDQTKTYVRSDRKGVYRISIPGGENVLNFSADGKEDLGLRVVVLSDGQLNVMMTEKVTMLKDAVVSAESMAQHRNTEMGVEMVSVKTLTRIPSAFGEGDVIKAVLTLPGVKSVGEASGGFNVRGGSADQNLILFDENTIYNPTHMFGIFSAFNPDIVKNVEMYKSSIPAEYGGRVSSVLNVTTRDGDAEYWRGSAGIGLLTSRFHLEGPLSKGKTSVIAAARTTYSNWILNLLPEDSAYSGGSAGFTDANLGITHRIDANNTLEAHGYYATDRFSFGGDTTFRYGNINVSLIWKQRTEGGGNRAVSAGYDRYTNRVSAHHWDRGAYDMDTYIRQGFFRINRKAPLEEDHLLSYGLHVTGYAMDPGIMTPYGTASGIKERRLDREYALEPALYAADTWKMTDEFSVEGGLRLSGFYAFHGRKAYGAPEVRLSGKYSPVENLSFKAGVNTLTQYIHLVTNTSAVSPMDTWKLSDDKIKPTWGWQAAGGVYWTELNTGIDFSLESYFKQTYRALDYKPGATLSMNPDLADELVPVKGRSYGVELMVKKTTGKLTGWASYGYSRALLREMQDRGNETIAGGNWYNAPYDKPHEFKFVGNYALTHRYSLSLNVDYSTGRPVTVPVGQYYYKGTYRMAYSDRNAFRIPDYFRMDVAVNIDPGHYLKALFHTTVTLGVYNVTGRKNPYSVFFQSSPYGLTQGYMLCVFATQIPYINLNILF